MNDRDLIEQFIRIERGSREVQILVCKIAWDGPHTPTREWVLGRALPPDTTEAAAHQDALELLSDSRFFGQCSECGARNPRGWMHTEELCQACASENHGVVY